MASKHLAKVIDTIDALLETHPALEEADVAVDCSRIGEQRCWGIEKEEARVSIGNEVFLVTVTRIK